jgi:sigma-B regulation protein RsbU (phosphoserine phosphatase)
VPALVKPRASGTVWVTQALLGGRDATSGRLSNEDAQDRLRAIVSITDTRIDHLDADELLEELLVRVVGLLNADTAAVLLLDAASQQLVARAAWGIEEEVRQGVQVAVGVGFAGRIAAERRPITLDRVDPTTVWNPILWRKGIRKMLGVPLVRGSELLGVLHVGRLADVGFTTEDAELLELVAARIAGAVQARLLQLERAVGQLVQRSLLPAALPRTAGVEFATRFVPTGHGGVGGDWYDAFVLPSGDLWVMVGDIAGHGLAAAVTMGRLRAALRAYALEDKSPEEVLVLADRKLQFFDPGETATVLCAVLPPPYESITLALAGHPPPLLVTPEGARYLEVPVSPPLGVTEIHPAATAIPFARGDVLLAYTDGLIERRGESLTVGFERLAAAAVAEEPELVCRRVMEVLVGDQEPGDDIVLIALRRAAEDEASPTP